MNARKTFLSAISAALLPFAAFAEEVCHAPAMLNVRYDNDLFTLEDRDYTAGLQLVLVSPTLTSFTEASCLPRAARRLNAHLSLLRPKRFDQGNMIMRLEQAIFTPATASRSDLIEDDRPYAGELLFQIGYNTRQGDELRTTLLAVGVAGPWSLAEETQNLAHDLTGSRRFRGWDHQIDNELILNLRHERAYRMGTRPLSPSLSADLITHWGGALGNAMTRLSAGFEVRLGRALPDDFGTIPIRPGGDNIAPRSGFQQRQGTSWHLFAGLDAYWSIYDISLDGNAFRDSHSVDKKPLVGELALGLALFKGRWKLSYAHYLRSREFDTQSEPPRFGSVTLSRAF